MKWKITAALLIFAGIGFGILMIRSLTKPDTRDEVEYDQVSIKKSQWEDKKVDDYDLIAFFSDSILSSYQMELSVRDGVVDSYRVTCFLPENDPCEQERFDPNQFTVPALFERLEAAITWESQTRQRKLSVSYDRVYGFPIVISQVDAELADPNTRLDVVSFRVIE